ncbi:DNA-binding MarR family transcriptional regulator [Nocardia transvalensis]|uniref:DNA-binding MarR family transcriptional regulator n=1 Tax=Nocardia transvalensis TaxID=37333 RepID=A0A7W9UKM7_9NOCA|nr:MarR family transcriptional regulator [Nocardia transvalensis]MBB5915810.1 DNA-binding MarR family transcriptional regulator [Nocardia transvalensis]
MSDSTPAADSSALAARELRVLVSRLRRRFLEAAGDDELTPSQLSVLGRLHRGATTASDIAAAEHVRPQAAAAWLAGLDERGLIERHPDPDDRRRQLVSLSEDGRALFEGRTKAKDEWLSTALRERYTEAERQTVLDALALLDRLGQA